MATVNQLLMTAEQYLVMPPPVDGSKVELVRGELETVCRPGFRHGKRQGRVYRLLDDYGRANRHGQAVVDTGVVTERDPDTVRGPDVAYWSAARLPLDQEPDGYPDMAPDLGVEVLSPSNRWEQIREKMQELFSCGVRMIWIIDPENRTVRVYRSLDEGIVLHENAILTAEDVLPGFSCRVADLFL